MSRAIWSSHITPPMDSSPTVLKDEAFQDIVENTMRIPLASNEITCPDPKAFRSMSRASLLLSHICMGAKEALAPYLETSPYSVGIYCAVENGPIDAASTAKIIETQDRTRFAELYRKHRNPKMYLKQLPNLVPAQMGISTGIRGPMNVYTHSLRAGFHALDQAQWDLRDGLIEAALVCASHAFDDFLVVKRTRAQDPRALAEGAAAVLLVKSDSTQNWSSKLKSNSNCWFGIADPIVNLSMELQ